MNLLCLIPVVTLLLLADNGLLLLLLLSGVGEVGEDCDFFTFVAIALNLLEIAFLNSA